MRLNFSNDERNYGEWPSELLAEDLLDRLSGFPKYPQTSKGREVFVEALMQCESEQHARRTVDIFDEKFPTLRELRDAVSNTKTKPKETTQADLIAQWEAEGATFDPDWWAQALRDALEAKKRKDEERAQKLIQEIETLRKGLDAVQTPEG